MKKGVTGKEMHTYFLGGPELLGLFARDAAQFGRIDNSRAQSLN